MFAPKPEVCEMDGNYRLQNRLTLLSRIWTSRSKSKRRIKYFNMMLKSIFKICSNFSEKAFFRISK